MPSVKVPVKILDEGLPRPSYAKPGDAGLDLRSTEDIVIEPGQRALIGTGIALAIPQGYAGFVQPRSGLAIKQGMTLVNTPGLIDSGYRGEIRIIALNTDKEHAIAIKRGDRIAQLVIQEVPAVELVEVEELSSSERADTGFGSSGL
ncbi:MAG: dUTP diphosphatase [Coriobacteriaceae bacterium]|nr:dUTP diphosphatase [Coriobacteriaceae bacterium]